jgi:hypothetical protein
MATQVKKKFTINVTKRDIDFWLEKSNQIAGRICEICAVARAIRRHKDLKDCKVTYSSIYSASNGNVRTNLPSSICTKIIAMDNMCPVAPFKFTIEVPIPVTAGA